MEVEQKIDIRKPQKILLIILRVRGRERERERFVSASFGVKVIFFHSLEWLKPRDR